MKKNSKNNNKMYDSATYAQIKQFNKLLEDHRTDTEFVQCIRDLIEMSLPESNLFSREIKAYNRITASVAAKQYNRIFNQEVHPKNEYVDININGEFKRITILNNNPGLYSIEGRKGCDLTLVEKDMALCKMTMEPNCVKINLPQSQDKFAKGLGEGIWVSVDDITMAAYNSNTQGGVYTGSLRNDSYYYPHLKWGHTISFEMRGMNRAVALI